VKLPDATHSINQLHVLIIFIIIYLINTHMLIYIGCTDGDIIVPIMKHNGTPKYQLMELTITSSYIFCTFDIKELVAMKAANM
jgi:hypothetical protein